MKEKFSINVSALSTYTDQNGDIKEEIILGSKTLTDGTISVQYGAIGDRVALNVLKNTITAVGGYCTPFADSGSTIFAQSYVQMYPIQFPDGICLDTLQPYFTSMYAQPGFNREDAGTLEDKLVSSKLNTMSLELGKILWRGANSGPAYVAGLTGSLTTANGFLQSSYAVSASTINVAKSAFTNSNALVIVQAIVDSIMTNAPVLIDSGCNMYLQPADFYKIVAAVVDTYKYNASLINVENITEFKHPVYPWLTFVKVNELTGVASGTSLVTPKENIWAVISDQSDIDFSMWFEKKDNRLYFLGKLRAGTGFYQPELLVRVA